MSKQDNLDDYDLIFLHVFAPVLSSYVKWVLNSAKELDVKRLYFLARDGWLMYHVAQLIAEQRDDIDIELRYIHVSRYALRNAEYSFIGRECLDTIFIGGIDITFEKLMKRAALTDDEIKDVAKELGMQDREKEILSFSQIQDLKIKADGCGDLLYEYVNNHANEFYENTSLYLKQQGLLDDVRYGIVDSGWLGSTQKSICRLIEHISGEIPQIEGFYFGIYEVPHLMPKDKYHGYYLRPNKDLIRKTNFSICLFETVCSSPEGMTLGYKNSNEKVEAVLSKDGNPNEKFMHRNLVILNTFISSVDKHWFNDANGFNERKKIVEPLLSRLMANPAIEEAVVYGTLQFCDDVLESQMQNVAANWDREELRKQRLFRKIRIKFFKSSEKLHESGWPEASIVNILEDGSISRRAALRSEHLYKWLMYVRKSI